MRSVFRRVQGCEARRAAPAAAAALPLPQTVIQPSRGWRAIDLRELWEYRELLGFLTWRDVKIRYKQTVLGFLWAFLQPFTKMVVFSVVFGGLAKMDSQGAPYPVFVYAGLLPWQFFSEALTRSSQSVVTSANVITKVYFPRLVVPLAAVAGCLVDFCISFLILVGLMIYYGMAPPLQILWVLPLAVATVVVSLGIGTLISALNVAYRDFRYVIPFVVQIWLFLTPVIYPVTVVPPRWRWVLALNPMSGIVDGFRSAILGAPFAWGNLAISGGVGAATFVASVMYFRRTERRFADII